MFDFTNTPPDDQIDRRAEAARELAIAVHELQPLPQDEPIEVQHSMLLMGVVHAAMAGMDLHLNGIHRLTFATFAGLLIDYLCDNAVLQFSEDAEDVMELAIEVLEENLERWREASAECPAEDDDEED